MPSTSKNVIYEFGPFRVNLAEKLLLRDGRPIPLPPQVFDLLLYFIQSDGRLIEKQELIEDVWKAKAISDAAMSRAISDMRKTLDDDRKNPRYILTVPKRGFRFIAEVKSISIADRAEIHGSDVTSPLAASETGEPSNEQNSEKSKLTVESGADNTQSTRETQESNPEPPINFDSDFAQAPSRKRKYFVAAGILLLLLSGISWWIWTQKIYTDDSWMEITSPLDDADIRQVVKDSQVFEFLELDVNPEKYASLNLPNFWLPSENGGQEIANVKTRFKRLVDGNMRYGVESRLERFDFTYVKVYVPGDVGRAGTIERWYLPLYKNGQLVSDRNVYMGPYLVHYTLRKLNGKWLIERSTTPTAAEKK